MKINMTQGMMENEHVIAQTKALRKAGFPIKRKGGFYTLKTKDGLTVYSAMKMSSKSSLWSVRHADNLFQ